MTSTNQKLIEILGLVARDFNALRNVIQAADAAPTVQAAGRNHMLSMGCMAGAATATKFSGAVYGASNDEVSVRMQRFYASLTYTEQTVRDNIAPLPKLHAREAIDAFMRREELLPNSTQMVH